jgi:hypothetical protein
MPGAVQEVVSMLGDAMPEDAGGPWVQPEEAELWLPLRQAGPRLGLKPDTVRKKLRRGELEGRKANDGSWLVRIMPGGVLGGATRHDAAPARHIPGTDTTSDTTPNAGVYTRLAAAEAANAELRAGIARLEGEVAWLRAEAERRRWPGLWPWFQRFWYGGPR